MLSLLLPELEEGEVPLETKKKVIITSRMKKPKKVGQGLQPYRQGQIITMKGLIILRRHQEEKENLIKKIKVFSTIIMEIIVRITKILFIRLFTQNV